MTQSSSEGSAAYVIRAITSLAEPIAEDLGLEIVEIQYRREAHGWVLRLIIDRAGGLSVDDCARMSNEIGRILEVEDCIEHAYHLEVSSPGLDRPLTTERDFLRNRGKKVRVITRESVDGLTEFVGTIEGFDDGAVTLRTVAGLSRVPAANISKAKLEIEF